MRWDISRPESRFGDRFVLVAGHTAPLVYATLAVFNEALRVMHEFKRLDLDEDLFDGTAASRRALLRLRELTVQPCLACELCTLHGSCAIDDDMNLFFETFFSCCKCDCSGGADLTADVALFLAGADSRSQNRCKHTL